MGFSPTYVNVRRYLREKSGRPVKLRMKVIFLDIDGVLINKASLLKMESDYFPDEKCVQRLNDVIKKTDANIVVSSCWRIGRTLAELRELLAGWGVEGTILDKTTDPVNSREREREGSRSSVGWRIGRRVGATSSRLSSLMTTSTCRHCLRSSSKPNSKLS